MKGHDTTDAPTQLFPLQTLLLDWLYFFFFFFFFYERFDACHLLLLNYGRQISLKKKLFHDFDPNDDTCILLSLKNEQGEKYLYAKAYY